jgi:hypothetical protein
MNDLHFWSQLLMVAVLGIWASAKLWKMRE